MTDVWVVCSPGARVGVNRARVEADCLTDEQRLVSTAISARSLPCIFVRGLPGTGKTASVIPHSAARESADEGGRERKRLKCEPNEIVWWNSGIPNPDMFSMSRLPGPIHQCARIVFEERVPPTIIKSIHTGTKTASTRPDLPFGGIPIVVLSSVESCPTQHSVAKIFGKGGTVPTVFTLTKPLRDADSIGDEEWYRFQQAILHPKPGSLSDNIGRELFYRSSYEAAGAVPLGKEMRSGKTWYGAATSKAEALRRNLKAVKALEEPYVILSPGNDDTGDPDPHRIIVYAGCRFVLQERLDTHARGSVGVVYDVVDDSEEESVLLERSGDVLTPKDKVGLWVKFEGSLDPVKIEVTKGKKSKVKRWPISCGPCYHLSDWENQHTDRLMFCPSSGWTDTTSAEDVVSALQIVVGRVASFSHFRYDNITVSHMTSCLEKVSEVWPAPIKCNKAPRPS